MASMVVQGSFRHGRPELTGSIQRRGNGTAFQLPPDFSGFGRGSGQRLPDAVRQKMESALGGDFSDVRIHLGAEANAIGAVAFTHGSNIYFAPGRYVPHTDQGQRLLGHELAHVLQQRAGRVRNPFGSGIAVEVLPGARLQLDRDHRVRVPLGEEHRYARQAPNRKDEIAIKTHI